MRLEKGFFSLKILKQDLFLICKINISLKVKINVSTCLNEIYYCSNMLTFHRPPILFPQTWTPFPASGTQPLGVNLDHFGYWRSRLKECNLLHSEIRTCSICYRDDEFRNYFSQDSDLVYCNISSDDFIREHQQCQHRQIESEHFGRLLLDNAQRHSKS